MAHPMGETAPEAVRIDFDRRIELEFHGARITSDGGLLAYGELDDALGLIDLATAALSDGRRGRNTRHRLAGCLRQSMFGRLAGHEDVNDAGRLVRDPAMRAVVDGEGLDHGAVSTSRMGRFETEGLVYHMFLGIVPSLEQLAAKARWVGQLAFLVVEAQALGLDRASTENLAGIMEGNPMLATIADILESKGTALKTVAATDSVASAVEQMAELNIGALPVVDGDRLVGIFSERDVIRRVVDRRLDPDATNVAEVMTSNPVSGQSRMGIFEALRMMSDRRFRHLPVVDGERLIGMVSMGDVIVSAPVLGAAHPIVLAALALGVPSAPIDAGEMGRSGTNFQHVLKFEPVEIADTDGHIVAVYEQHGLTLLADGEIARFKNNGTSDCVNGEGVHRGYWITTFQGGSTTTTLYEGVSENTTEGRIGTGTYKYVNGTGRFAGIQGTGSYRGTHYDTMSIYEWEETITLPD
jgi:CBS domain-containing protein